MTTTRRPALLGPPTPSCLVTADMLDAWGFVTEVTDKVVGSKVVVRKGMTFGAARHAAWVAGLTRLTGGVFVAPPTPVADPATVAWALSITRPKDLARRGTVVS